MASRGDRRRHALTLIDGYKNLLKVDVLCSVSVTMVTGMSLQYGMSVIKYMIEFNPKIQFISTGLAGAAAVAIHAFAHLDKECIHTSAFTGQNWLDELLKGNHCICV